MNRAPEIARRMQRIQPFYVMDLLARARALEAQGRSIIHMEVGEPDFITAEPIVRAAHQALDQGRTHYTPALGLPVLRQAIAEDYESRFQVSVDPNRVLLTPGASGALQLVLSVLVNPGETVIMADPGYPCNRHFVELLGGVPQPVAVTADSGYQLTLDQLRHAWKPSVRAVLLASPSNPTGTQVSDAELKAMQQWVSAHGATLIVDEIYQNLVYDEAPRTALSHTDDLFIVNSFSKYFGMTGWRLGWAVVPHAYLDALERLAQNIFLSPPTLSQYAALAAFSPETLEILEDRRREFQHRRDYLLPALRELGFSLPITPQGAFYLYADCGELTEASSEFVTQLLSKVGVAVTPGLDFGDNAPQQHLRFAYTTSLAQLKEGVRRIAQFIGAP